MTRSHANKATFSPPFLHPPSPSTATNATPQTTDHMGEARGHRRRHTVGVQGMPAIFIFYLLFHLLRLNPQQPQHVPLHGKHADAPLLPPTTNPRCPPPAEHVPTSPPSFRTPESAHVGTFWCSRTSPLPSPSRTPERACMGTFWCSRTSPLPLPHLEHQNEPVCGSFWCSHTSALPFSRLEHQNEPTRARSDVQAPFPISTTRTCPHELVLVLAHLSSPSPSSRTPERAHMGSFWCSRTSPLPLLCLEHQNEPTRARSDVRAPLPVSTTRTCPHSEQNWLESDQI